MTEETVSANNLECFECLGCHAEFRAEIPEGGMAELLSFPCRRCGDCKKAKGLDKSCRGGGCPRCGSSYLEWLSYDLDAEKIYLSAEWEPDGRVWVGNVERLTLECNED